MWPSFIRLRQISHLLYICIYAWVIIKSINRKTLRIFIHINKKNCNIKVEKTECMCFVYVRTIYVTYVALFIHHSFPSIFFHKPQKLDFYYYYYLSIDMLQSICWQQRKKYYFIDFIVDDLGKGHFSLNAYSHIWITKIRLHTYCVYLCVNSK